MSSIEQVNDNLMTTSGFLPITREEQRVLDKVVRIHMSTGAISCTGCGYCADECPKNVDIPTAFSLYNDYLRNGINFLRFYGHISTQRRADKCVGCGKCKQFCSQHIDIPEELGKIVRVVKKMSSPSASKEQKVVLDLAAIEVNNELFVTRNHFDCLELFRCGRHCLGAPAKGENRWARFPLSRSLDIGQKYRLEFRVMTTYPMQRSFFLLGANGKTQYLPVGALPANEWITREVEFVTDTERTTQICITATDLPVVGNSFFIKELNVIAVVG
jgi:ferredoxin